MNIREEQKKAALEAGKQGIKDAYEKSKAKTGLKWWGRLLWVVLAGAAYAASALLGGCGHSVDVTPDRTEVKAGLTAEDMAPLQSPKGFKLLHALMSATGEDSFVGAKNAAPGRSNAEEAHAMLTDPNHPDYAALDDPTHPRHMEVNRKYNRLVGLV